MKIHFKKKTTWIAIISMVITIALMHYAYAKLHLNYSAEDRQIARDLAALSGLPEDDVFSIRDVIDDWEAITGNIFIYKDILTRVGDNKKDKKTTFKLIGQYPAQQVLTVYQYLDQNGRHLSDAGDLLEKAGSESMEAILSGTVDSKLYEAYKPAGKEQIRQWLAEGYAPQDILNADTISMAKDMKIGAVLAMKNSSNTWEDIGKRLDYEFKSESTGVAVQMPDNGQTRKISSSDYQTLVKEANARAEQKRVKKEADIRKNLKLPASQIEKLHERGFSLRDLENARRLSNETNISMEQLLKERNQGKSWAELLAKYHKTGKGESE